MFNVPFQHPNCRFQIIDKDLKTSFPADEKENKGRGIKGTDNGQDDEDDRFALIEEMPQVSYWLLPKALSSLQFWCLIVQYISIY